MLVDVTVPLRAGLPHWPGESGFERHVKSSTDAGDEATVSKLEFGAHTATHMDAPNHFLSGADGIDTLPLEACIGPAYVADLTELDGQISAGDLEAAGIPSGCERLLVKTRNSGWSKSSEFDEGFCAYDASAAQWCVDRGIKFVANDYLSIEPFGSEGHATHKTFLRAGVVILEGVELEGVEPGEWDLIALPIPVKDGDGAPARVVLRR